MSSLMNNFQVNICVTTSKIQEMEYYQYLRRLSYAPPQSNFLSLLPRGNVIP